MLRFQHKVVRLSQIGEHCQILRSLGERIVATSGCFDLLHPGHVLFLHQARSLFGSHLVVCLNSDASVRRLKGKERPCFAATDRALMLSGLESVGTIVVFDDDTPEGVLEGIQPHAYVKDIRYRTALIPEEAVVLKYGGEVFYLTREEGYSTTGIIERLRSRKRKRR